MDNRGRFQAQGKKNLEESEAWAQEDPLYLDQAKVRLTSLKEKLSLSERKKREKAFIQCESFIIRASENGGVSVVDKAIVKSFPGNNQERVDIEVWKGKAFLKRNDETS